MDRRECTHTQATRATRERGSIPRRESCFILLIDLVINEKRRKLAKKISLVKNIKNSELRTASS